MSKVENGRLCLSLNKVAFVFCVLLMINCTFFGTANYVTVFGIGLLGFLVAVMDILAVPNMLRDFKRVATNPYLWMLIAYAIWNLVAALIGAAKGNAINAILTDINGVIYFIEFPVILCILTNKKRVHLLMKGMIYAALAEAVFCIILLWAYVTNDALFQKLLAWCRDGEFINFTNISSTIPRILLVSSIFQLCSCAFSFYFILIEPQIELQYILGLGVGLFSILLTYTRALYLAAFVTALLIILLQIFYAKRLQSGQRACCAIASGVVVFVILVLSTSLVAKTNYFGYGVERVFAGFMGDSIISVSGSDAEASDPAESTEGVTDSEHSPELFVSGSDAEASDPAESTEGLANSEYLPDAYGMYNEESYINATIYSDMMREQVMSSLIEIIKENPLVGVGLGAELPGNRINTEYSFHGLCAKKGIIGVVLYLLPALWLLAAVIKDLFSKRELLLSAVWGSVLIGFMAFSYYQPYMNNAPCMLLYCCALCVHNMEKERMAPN